MAEAKSRIYRVTSPDGVRLVRAQNKVQAIRHVAEVTIGAEVASQDALFELAQAGVKIEEAKTEGGE